jgi:transposase-like protein
MLIVSELENSSFKNAPDSKEILRYASELDVDAVSELVRENVMPLCFSVTHEAFGNRLSPCCDNSYLIKTSGGLYTCSGCSFNYSLNIEKSGTDDVCLQPASKRIAYHKNSPVKPCPYCNSHCNIERHGVKRGSQWYHCNGCNRLFSNNDADWIKRNTPAYMIHTLISTYDRQWHASDESRWKRRKKRRAFHCARKVDQK